MEEGSGTPEAGKRSTVSGKGLNRSLSVLDLILRVVAALGTLGSAVAMGTAKETLPFFTLFVQFSADYKDLPSFTFFVVANSVVCAYLFLSLPLSIFHITRRAAVNSRIVLITFDTIMLAVLTSGASAAAAIVYLSHKGNSSANWSAICQQFNGFCRRVSGSLIGSFVGVVLLILTIILSSMSAAKDAIA